MGDQTPKKIVSSTNVCFICQTEVTNDEKILIFGRSSVDIPRILKDVGIDVQSYLDLKRPALCRKTCYKKVVKLERMTSNLELTKLDIKTEFVSKMRAKRVLREDNDNKVDGSEPPKKALFSNKHQSTPHKSYIQPTPCELSPISVYCNENISNQQLISRDEASKECARLNVADTKVYVTVKYPCGKTIKKKLDGTDFEKLGKAIARGTHVNAIAALFKIKDMRESMIAMLLKALSNECMDLCSKKNPSLLRKNTKPDLENLSMEKICMEWKSRAPLFYSILLTCCTSNSKNGNNTGWFPSMAVAGSTLLRERNTQLSALASVLGLTLKTRSVEVR